MTAPEETFRKGQMVRTTAPITGWRPITPEERQEWYERFWASCREGRDVPYGSDGESKLAPNEITEIIPDGTVCEVLRGRVRAPLGWSAMSGCLQVRIPGTGSVLFIRRKGVTGAW